MKYTREQKLKQRETIIAGIVDDAMRMGAAIGHWATDEIKVRSRAGREAMNSSREVFTEELVRIANDPCLDDEEAIS